MVNGKHNIIIYYLIDYYLLLIFELFCRLENLINRIYYRGLIYEHFKNTRAAIYVIYYDNDLFRINIIYRLRKKLYRPRYMAIYEYLDLRFLDCSQYNSSNN